MSKLAARWTRLTVNSRLQRSSQCLAVVGSQAWIFGGELQPRQPVDSQFDVVSLNGRNESNIATTLRATTDLIPIARVGATSIAIDSKLYMFSGRGGLEMKPIEEKGALWQYDSNTSIWEIIKPEDPAAPYPPGRSYHAMTSDNEENIYIHAGCPETGRLSDLWSFNLKLKAWSELKMAPLPARGGTSITSRDGKLYRMNGFDGQTEQGGAIDIYDIKTDSWSTLSFRPDGVGGPKPRSVSALLPIQAGEKQYIVTLFGERDPSSLGHAGAGRMLGDAWAFDLGSKEWSSVEPIGESPSARGWFAADVADQHEGKQVLIVHGGLAEDNTRLGDIWKMELE